MKRATAVTLALTLMVTCAGLVAADELGSAQRRATALNFINSLGMSPQQASAMAAPLGRIQTIVEGVRADRAAAPQMNDGVQTLQQARMALMADHDLLPEALASITSIEQRMDATTQAGYLSVAAEMATIADLMTDEQNARLDWLPPASIRPAPTARQRAQLQAAIEARVGDAIAMLSRVKYLDAFNYVTGRQPIIDEYLQINQQFGALPENAVDVCLYYTDQARLVAVDQWQQTAPMMAAQMVTQLNLMPSLYPAPKPGAMDWWSLYRILTAPETLEVVQELPEARG